VLFSASYFPDQFKYAGAVREVRDSLAMPSDSGSIASSSWMLAMIPLPFVETIKSLGFFNKFIYIIMFMYLYKKNALTTFSAYFLLLYPSIILYTGLSLRDTLIFCSMMMIAYFAIKQNLLLMFVFFIPLSLLKFQNFYMMLPFVPFVLFNLSNKGLTVGKGTLLLGILFVALLLSFPVATPLINHYRLALYEEDGGTDPNEVKLIGSVAEFISMGLTSGVYFFAKPLPWESGNPLQLIQSIENLIIMFIVIKLSIRAWRADVRKLIFWMVVFIGSLSIYGLVIYNYGTAARYRFPFIAMYVVYVAYSCNISRLFTPQRYQIQ
jgi:hypothetical protein